MNERIKELVYEAGIRFSTTGTVIAGDRVAIEKLAELLIKECGAVADKVAACCGDGCTSEEINEHFELED